MERILDIIAGLLNGLLSRLNPNESADINVSSTAYSKDDGFQLYVGVEGNVKGTTLGGNPVNRRFIAGYHPTKMKFIDTVANGTTATNLAACY